VFINSTIVMVLASCGANADTPTAQPHPSPATAPTESVFPSGDDKAGAACCACCCDESCGTEYCETTCQPAPCSGCGCGHCLYRLFCGCCDLVPHLPYFPPRHGYYYFRPYNIAHLQRHQEMVVRWGEDPRNPYGNEVFTRVYAALENAGPGSPFLEELVVPPTPVNGPGN
jgi:hypothetical protein